MNLRELQQAIDYVRENFDNWAEIPIQSETSLSNDKVLISEIESSFIDDEGEFFVFLNK